MKKKKKLRLAIEEYEKSKKEMCVDEINYHVSMSEKLE